MVHDINRALMYGDRHGHLQPTMAKRRFCVVDGLIAGEGFGPMSPDPLAAGVVLAGRNPVAVDLVGAELMGFDYERIPMLAEAFVEHPLPLVEFRADEISITSNVGDLCGNLDTLRHAGRPAFAAPLGWIDFIERAHSNGKPA